MECKSNYSYQKHKHQTKLLFIFKENNGILKLNSLDLDVWSNTIAYTCYRNNVDCDDGNDGFITLLLSLYYYL